jgi:hypothetical protein
MRLGQLAAGASLALLAGPAAAAPHPAPVRQAPGAPAARAPDLALLPARVTLTGRESSQRLLVERRRAGVLAGDLSAKARFQSSNPRVATVDAAGVVRAVGDGRARVTATVGGASAAAAVEVRGTRVPLTWSFRNQVLPLMTKAACNSGACHGATAGKGGFKLTLRGYDPAADHAALTRQAWGRRIALADPARSLALRKATMAVAHGGGVRFTRGSPDYRIFAAWIAAGAPPPRADDPRVTGLEILPRAATLAPGATQQVLVRARYSDGRSEDVTRWVKWGTNDSTVATVDDAGRVKVQGRGEAAITVWYQSRVGFATVSVPYRAAPASLATAERRNFIDNLILKKLATLGLPPSGAAADATFVRRAYLDAAGILPTPEDVAAYVAARAAEGEGTQAPPTPMPRAGVGGASSRTPGSTARERLIDSLLARPEFVDYWTYKWSDLLLVSTRKLSPTAMWAFHNWIRQAVAENRPWDRFARDVVTATGSNVENGAASYFVLHKNPIELTETTAQAFLGMSLTCARCHNHPLEKWTQNQYYEMANLFARVALKNGDGRGETLVLVTDTGNIEHPRLGVPLPPRPLDATALALDAPGDRRRHLADWLTAPANPYFSRALVNRVWRNFMGRGLVEAEDDLRLTNPPANEELLAALARDFANNGFDVRRLIRQIMLSAAYGRSSDPVAGNEADQKYYSRYLVRRLPAEVLLDAISQAAGVPTEFPGYPKGTRALELPDSQVASFFLSAFGRPERIQTCSCERTEGTTTEQALHLSNGDTINQKLRAKDGTIDRLLAEKRPDEQLLDRAFQLVFGRSALPAEQARILPLLAAAPEGEARHEAVEDLFWSLLTSKEFLFNH